MARGRCDGTDRFWGRTVNWFDFVLLAIIAVGAVMGLRIGLIGAAFTVVGVFVGWLLAGQWSDDVGGLFGDSLSLFSPRRVSKSIHKNGRWTLAELEWLVPISLAADLINPAPPEPQRDR